MSETNGSGTARLAAALVKAQSAFPSIPRTHTVKTGTYSYKYADLADVLAAVGPALRAHGLVLVFGAELTDTCSIVTATLLHESGESLRASLPLIVSERPQETGSRITYLKRYLASLVTGTATEDDDDGQRGAGEPRGGGKRQQRAAAGPAVTTAAPAPWEGQPASAAPQPDTVRAMRKEAWEDIKAELSRVFGASGIWESAPKKAALAEAFGTYNLKEIAALPDARWCDGLEKLPAAIKKAAAAHSLNATMDRLADDAEREAQADEAEADVARAAED